MSRREALGKGLGALIPAGASALEEIPVTSISPNTAQPRRQFEDETIATLAASIRQVGLLQPVVVRQTSDGRFQLVVGERRWRAARRAGLTTVPALVVETDDKGALQRAMIENLHRQDLGPLEEAAAYEQMIQEGGLTHEQLAEQVGLSRPAVTNAMRLLELPPGVQGLIRQGRLTAGHGRALLGFQDEASIERMGAKVASEGLSVRQAEELAATSKAATRPIPGRPGSTPPAALLELSQSLSEELQTRVSVSMSRKKGRIVIEFGSIEDLDRIYRQISPRLRGEDSE